MRVRKEVNLTVETANIANNVRPNFSEWVRHSLRAYANGEDLGSETMRRLRWAKAARLLAESLVEYALQVDPTFNGDIDRILAKAVNQTTLEEFEV